MDNPLFGGRTELPLAGQDSFMLLCYKAGAPAGARVLYTLCGCPPCGREDKVIFTTDQGRADGTAHQFRSLLQPLCGREDKAGVSPGLRHPFSRLPIHD